MRSRRAGTGKTDMAAIIAGRGAGRYAAHLCSDLSFGGFNDWFLPSMDESLPYWSPTRSGTYACYQDFGSDAPGNGTTDYECKVRAVKAF